jgi:hypothetical protein
MGNNQVSEFWGGGALSFPFTIPPDMQQRPTRNVFINSDISGTWGGSSIDISKSLIGPSGIIFANSFPYGYINNFLKIPRNLDGSGIIIDPKNVLFPDELCDPFRYLKLSNLRTYLVVRMPLPVKWTTTTQFTIRQPVACDSSLNQVLVKSYALVNNPPGGGIVSGQVDSLCCIGTFNLPSPFFRPGHQVDAGTFGLFDVYINLFHINNWNDLNLLLKAKVSINPITNLSDWPGAVEDAWDVTFSKNQVVYGLPFNFVRAVRIIQGTIPSVLNQSKYNATRQSYMTCLENGTRNINFTRPNTKLSITNAFCTPCLPTGSHSYIVSGQNWTNYPNPTWTIGNKNIYEFINVSGSISIELEEFDCGATLNMDLIAIGGGGGGGTGKRTVTFSGAPITYHLSSAGGGGGGGGVGVCYNYQVHYTEEITFDVIAGTGGAGADPDAAPDLSGNDGTSSRITVSGAYGPILDVSGGKGGGSGTPNALNNYTGATWMWFGGAGKGGDSGRSDDCPFHFQGNPGGLGVENAQNTNTPNINDWSIMAFGGGGGGGSGDVLNPFPSFGGDGGNAGSNAQLYTTNWDVSGGSGGAGFILDISGTTYRYGGGGGGGAVPWQTDRPDGVGIYQSANGIGGEGNSAHSYPCDPSGGGNGVPIPAVTIVSDISTTSLASGADGICVGEGGGGGVAYGKSIPPGTTTNTVAGTGGDGADGAVYIIIYDKV